jgi:hypothetical protein
MLECKNYRVITLLNIAYKGLSCITRILERINQYAESILEECQCGFRRGRSTVEQIFIIRQLMEMCFEFNTVLHILLVDYKKKLLITLIEQSSLMQWETRVYQETCYTCRNDYEK